MQEIVDQEEIEWHNRLKTLEEVIFENRQEELERRHVQLRTIWDVIVNGWYRDYKNRDDNSESTLEEWLNYLRLTGGVPTSYPTWREQHKTVVALMSDGIELDDAIKAACVAPRLATIFEENKVLEITSPEGDRVLPTGEPVKISYGDKAEEILDGQTFGEYGKKIASMPSSRHANDTIRHDLKVDSVNISNMWEGEAVTDASFRKWWGEMMVHTSDGDTPYQFVLWLERDMPVSAQRISIRKLSQKFAYLAMEAPSHNTEMSSQDDD